MPMVTLTTVGVVVKVFVSWSGPLSNKLADAFRTWLPAALQSVEPYFTPADIEKGARWHTDISKELEESEIGVLFVTRNNIASQWLLYEAGALSKKLDKSKVCPIVFGIGQNDLPGPLRQFQATEFNKEDFRQLLKTINSSSGSNKLKDSVLDEAFDMWWPRLKEKFDEVLSSEESNKNELPIRTDRDIIEEILEIVRLRAQKSSKMHDINPKAVHYLILKLGIVVDMLREGRGQNQIIDSLEEMRKPIRHIVFQTPLYEEEDLEGLLESISFHHVELDDEIPF